MTDESYSEREKLNQVWPFVIRSMKQKEKVNYDLQPMLWLVNSIWQEKGDNKSCESWRKKVNIAILNRYLPELLRQNLVLLMDK